MSKMKLLGALEIYRATERPRLKCDNTSLLFINSGSDQEIMLCQIFIIEDNWNDTEEFIHFNTDENYIEKTIINIVYIKAKWISKTAK